MTLLSGLTGNLSVSSEESLLLGDDRVFSVTIDFPTSHRIIGQFEQTNSLDDWELNSVSHKGEFCTVTQARPAGRQAKFLYAIKQLAPKWRRSHIGQATLKREAELGRLISHPHIVPVLDGNPDADEPFLVQPWLQGESLQDILSKRRAMPPIEVLWVARQIAEALTELETHEFCHSDIKPANIMISESGHVTLIDLGLARRKGEACLPMDQAIVGTPKYMATEVREFPEQVGIRADIYSLGQVMLEMLFGNVIPVVDSSSEKHHPLWRACWDALTAKYAGTLPSAQTVNKLESLLAAMTASDAAKRPTSANNLVRQLISLELALI